MIAAIARRIQERENVLATVREFARQAEERLGPCTVVLFGSYARGDFNIGSDIDVLVLSPRLPARFVDRLGLLLGLVDAPIQPFPYTPEEFERMEAERHPTALAARTDGVVMTGSLGSPPRGSPTIGGL